VSDISLGDFWGIGSYDASLDNEKGTSVVIINSKKGEMLLSWAQDLLVLSKRTLDEVLAGNSCLLTSAVPGEFREFFFQNMDKYRFDELIGMIDRKSAKISFGDRLLQLLSRIKRSIIGSGK
jgi:hypothetical protein